MVVADLDDVYINTLISIMKIYLSNDIPIPELKLLGGTSILRSDPPPQILIGGY